MTQPQDVANSTPEDTTQEKSAENERSVETTQAVESQSSSDAFVGKWRKLISTTNWQKGQIISEWRQRLMDGGAQAADYSDDAWSRLVGDVSPQHVGRLRRVYDQFGDVWDSYTTLFWTHFLAALDWEDAEMWLEGAKQNGWSVSKMRNKRWETLGGIPADQPLEADMVAEEVDADPFSNQDDAIHVENIEAAEPLDEVSRTNKNVDSPDAGPIALEEPTAVDIPVVPPLASFDDLPNDFVDSFENFKLILLSYKLAGWTELTKEEALGSLETLRVLVSSS